MFPSPAYISMKTYDFLNNDISKFIKGIRNDIQTENAPITEEALAFSLSVVRCFGLFRGNEKRLFTATQECVDALKNQSYRKLCLMHGIKFPRTSRQIIESYGDKEYNVINAASYFLYVKDPALQNRLISYAFVIINTYGKLNLRFTAWYWKCM